MIKPCKTKPDLGKAGPAEPTPAVSVAVWRDRQVLVVQRGRPPNAGLWALPGGKVEPGETLRDAAMREVQEETGITCKLGSLLQERVLTGDGFSYHLTSFNAVWQTGEPKAGDDAKEARFVSLEQLGNLVTVTGLSDLLRAHEPVKKL